MIEVLTCPEGAYLPDMRIPLCNGDMPTAQLRRAWHSPIDLPVDFADPDDHSDDILRIGPLPSAVSAGVWSLLVNSPCGCFVERISVRCPAPAHPPTHTPTDTGWPPDGAAPPECEPTGTPP